MSASTQDGRIHPLPGATNDAKEMHELLVQNGAFEVAKDHLLLNKAANVGCHPWRGLERPALGCQRR